MEKKNNSLGIVLISIGILLLIQKFFNISILDIILWTALGISLLYLYKNKNEKWAMPLGVFATYWGISKILMELDIISIFAVFGGLLWFTIGIILMILYFEKNKLYLFNTGLILFSVGVSIFATSYKISYMFISFNITMVIGLFLGYYLSNKTSNLNLFFGIFYLFLVLKSLVFNNITMSIPLFLIISGIIIYFVGRKKTIKKDEIIDTNNNNSSNPKFNEFNN